MRRGLVTQHHLASAPAAGLAAVLALALLVGGGVRPGLAQAGMAPANQCNAFQGLNQAAAEKAAAVQNAIKAKADRKEICKLMTIFVTAETKVVKFLVDNKTWCGVPDPVIANANKAHDHSMKFRDQACAEGPAGPKPPSLSDALNSTPLDTSANTNTKRGGTFDTLTGNPLGR